MYREKIIAKDTIRLYRYEGSYVTEAQVLKLTKNRWTEYKDNRTKKTILNKVERWADMPGYIVPVSAVEVYDMYYVTDDGSLLNKTYQPMVMENSSIVRLQINGERRRVYIQDLMYYGFVDRTIDPTKSNVWLTGINVKNIKPGDINLGVIELKSTLENKVESAITARKNDSVAAQLEEALKEIERLKKEIDYLTNLSPQQLPSSSGKPQAHELLFGEAAPSVVHVKKQRRR